MIMNTRERMAQQVLYGLLDSRDSVHPSRAPYIEGAVGPQDVIIDGRIDLYYVVDAILAFLATPSEDLCGFIANQYIDVGNDMAIDAEDAANVIKSMVIGIKEGA